MTHKELRAFLTAEDALGNRLPDSVIMALLKAHCGFAKKEIELHVPVEQLIAASWLERVNGRLRLKLSAKTRLGLIGKEKKEADPRVDELVRIYRDVIQEVHKFNPLKLHAWGSVAKAAKELLKEADIHPKLKNYSREEQLTGIKRIIHAMAETEDKYDRRYFEARRWHLWAFAQQFFKYIAQMLAVEESLQTHTNAVTDAGKGKL